LGDDELITGISIESYELLAPHSPNYVDLDVTATITAVTPMRGNILSPIWTWMKDWRAVRRDPRTNWP